MVFIVYNKCDDEYEMAFKTLHEAEKYKMKQERIFPTQHYKIIQVSYSTNEDDV